MAGIRYRRLKAGKPLLFPNMGKRKTLDDFAGTKWDDGTLGGGNDGGGDGSGDGGGSSGGGDTGEFAAPDVTNPETPVRMPDPNDPRQREAERRRILMARLRGGRLGTILSPELQSRVGTRRLSESG